MVDDTMKIFNSFNFVALWLFAWRKDEQSAKKNAEDTMSRVEQILAMGDILNDSIGRALHDTKRLSSKSGTRSK